MTSDGLSSPLALPDADMPREVLALMVMVDHCSAAGQVELERMLTAKLHRSPTPTECRLAELLPLAEVLESSLAVRFAHHPVSPVQVDQLTYNRVRPAGAISAETLAERYGGAANGGWHWACRAAWGLMPDGRKSKPGGARPYGTRGRSRPTRSSPEAVLASIRECALALCRRPTSNVFHAWVDARRRETRARRGPRSNDRSSERLFHTDAVYEHFPDWSTALASANITDADLAVAQAARLPAGPASAVVRGPSAAEVLRELDPASLALAGFTEEERARLARRGPKGFLELSFSRAAALAHALGGSVDWLVDPTSVHDEVAPANSCFDGHAFNRARKERHLREDAVLSKARLSLGRYRGIIKGSTEPTLGQAARLGVLVRSRIDALVVPGPERAASEAHGGDDDGHQAPTRRR